MSDDKEIRIDINDGDQTTESQTADGPVDPESKQPAEPVEVEKKSEEEQLREKLSLAENKLLLAMADFENYKKRQARRQEEFYRTANDSLLIKLLDVIDNFERALAHAGEIDSTADADTGLLDGTKMILKQLHGILEHYQIVPIEALGKPFDPALHEALMQLESDEFDEGIISAEIAKGYQAGQRVLRHSKVGVSKGVAKAQSEDVQEDKKSNNNKPDNDSKTSQ